MILTSPRPLEAAHRVDDFACGEEALDDWLRRRARANQESGASRTFVVVDSDARVVGYYALAAGSVSHAAAPGRVRRNMPEPIPVLVLGRLAVDLRAQGHMLGAGLLQDAVKRAHVVADHVGVRALLVHALGDRAVRFYERYGFQRSPIHERTLMLPLPTLRTAGSP